jgi:hypothetical protein
MGSSHNACLIDQEVVFKGGLAIVVSNDVRWAVRNDGRMDVTQNRGCCNRGQCEKALSIYARNDPGRYSLL